VTGVHAGRIRRDLHLTTDVPSTRLTADRFFSKADHVSPVSKKVRLSGDPYRHRFVWLQPTNRIFSHNRLLFSNIL